MIDNREKRDKINSIMRFIAFNIFNHRGKPNYTRSYDKLKATVLLDWDISLNDRLKEENKDNLFDVLHSDGELDMVYKSSLKLSDMYREVLERRSA